MNVNVQSNIYSAIEPHIQDYANGSVSAAAYNLDKKALKTKKLAVHASGLNLARRRVDNAPFLPRDRDRDWSETENLGPESFFDDESSEQETHLLMSSLGVGIISEGVNKAFPPTAGAEIILNSFVCSALYDVIEAGFKNQAIIKNSPKENVSLLFRSLSIGFLAVELATMVPVASAIYNFLNSIVGSAVYDAAKAVLGLLKGIPDPPVRTELQTAIAIEKSKEAVKTSREYNDRPGESISLGMLGIAHQQKGETQEAIQYYKHAGDISREILDWRSTATWLGNIGNAYLNSGHIDLAIGYYTSAITISHAIGDLCSAMKWLCNLGNAYYKSGEVTQAIECYKKALTISRQMEDYKAEGIYSLNLGIAYRNIKELKLAEQYLTRATIILEAVGSPYAEKARRLRNKVRWEIDLFTSSSSDSVSHQRNAPANLKPTNTLTQTQQATRSFDPNNHNDGSDTGLITIDLTKVNKGHVSYRYDLFKTVQGLLECVYQEFLGDIVSPASYAHEWLFIDAKTGKSFSELAEYGDKGLSDVGINPGAHLKVKLIRIQNGL